ncbi:MAG: hypothetical protein M5U12_36425 [Verrucomicrobia bacterium]|nr:hypothetical protein [Verrucomicrobiota bacterium]
MSLEPRSPGSVRFPPTHWSVVVAAGSPEQTVGWEALSQICDAYWHPLYAFARKLGYLPADAQDLTQGFLRGCWSGRFWGGPTR